MSAEQGFDFNQLALRSGLGKGSSDGGGDGANEKDLIQTLVVDAAAEKPHGLGAKLTGGLLPNLSQLGSISITQSIDRAESWIDQKMNQGAESGGAKGGFLARLAATLLKRAWEGVGGSVHTGEGGGGEGGGGGSSGGGGGSDGGFESGGGSAFADSGFHGHSDFGHGGGEVMAVSYGDKYTAVHVDSEMLGKLTPKSTGDASFSPDAGVQIG